MPAAIPPATDPASEPAPPQQIASVAATDIEIPVSPSQKITTAYLNQFGFVAASPDPVVQEAFSQGVFLLSTGQDPKAAAAFRRARDRDPYCAMCYWGLATASANTPEGARALQKAQNLHELTTPKQKAIIAAAAKRYLRYPRADQNVPNPEYAVAMEQLARRYSQDPNIQVLAAETILEFSTANQQPPDRTTGLMILDSTLQRYPDHPSAQQLKSQVSQ
jgi:hypothetical protein